MLARRAPLLLLLAVAVRAVACGGSSSNSAGIASGGATGGGGSGTSGASPSSGTGGIASGGATGGGGSTGGTAGGGSSGGGGGAECLDASDCDPPSTTCVQVGSGPGSVDAAVRYFTDPACEAGKCTFVSHDFPCNKGASCQQGQCQAGTPQLIACSTSDVCTTPTSGCTGGNLLASYSAPKCVDGVCEWTRTIQACRCPKGAATCAIGGCYASTVAGAPPCTLSFVSEGAAAGPPSAGGQAGK